MILTPFSAAAVGLLLVLGGCSGGGGSAVPTSGTHAGKQSVTTNAKQSELDAFLLRVHPLQVAVLVCEKAIQRGVDGYTLRANPTKALARTQAAIVVKAGEGMQSVSTRISAVVAPIALKAAWARHARAVWADGQTIKSLGEAVKARDTALISSDLLTLLPRAVKAGRFYDALIRYSVADQLTLPNWVKNPRY